VPTVEELEKVVLDTLATDVRSVVERFPQVEISYQAAHGGPAARLIEVSVSARMLVVGSRGLGAFAEMMLGSVSDEVVRKARCPVLVTKEPHTA
jgi:nucleotide-binding universal stress UspA family protein